MLLLHSNDWQGLLYENNMENSRFSISHCQVEVFWREVSLLKTTVCPTGNPYPSSSQWDVKLHLISLVMPQSQISFRCRCRTCERLSEILKWKRFQNCIDAVTSRMGIIELGNNHSLVVCSGMMQSWVISKHGAVGSWDFDAPSCKWRWILNTSKDFLLFFYSIQFNLLYFSSHVTR